MWLSDIMEFKICFLCISAFEVQLKCLPAFEARFQNSKSAFFFFELALIVRLMISILLFFLFDLFIDLISIIL